MQLISYAVKRLRFGYLPNIVDEVVSEVLLFFGFIQEWYIRSVVKSVELFSNSLVLKLDLATSSCFLVLNKAIS